MAAGVFILAPLGVYIQHFEERMGAPRSFAVATVVDAIVLISTTAFAFSSSWTGKSNDTGSGWRAATPLRCFFPSPL